MATFREMKTEHWEDVVNAFLGAVLFLSKRVLTAHSGS